MRYLGIDYGSKRVGLALSDEEGKLAFPLAVLDNSESLLSGLVEMCKDKDVGLIVMGDSKDFTQKDNKIMEEIRPFASHLADATKLSVEFHPEFLSSHQAEKLQGKNDMLDASAAAVILQSFLDTRNSSKL